MAHLTRTQLVAGAIVVLAVLVLGGRWLARPAGADTPGSASASGSPGWTSGAPAAAEPSGDLVAVSTPSRATVVHVAGAVRRPGVYRLAAGARVRDAVARAGGPTGRADANAINLAAVLQDGVQVVVPRRMTTSAGNTVPGAVTGASGGPPPAPVNLNTATADELDTLDGVGPATAAKILEYRSAHGGFRSVEDLGEVSGIGPKRLEALRTRVVV